MSTHKKTKSLVKVSPQLNLGSFSVKQHLKKPPPATRVKQKSLFTGEKEKILFKLINSKAPESNIKELKSEEKPLKAIKKNTENYYNPNRNVQEIRFIHATSYSCNSPNGFYPIFNSGSSPNPHNAEKFRVIQNKKKANLPRIDSALMISKKKMTSAASVRGHYLSF